MARIEGITIAIGGDLSGLNAAIKDANKEINSMQRELRGVDSLLKFDPGNLDLLTQKEKLLGAAISSTKDKLAGLQAAKTEADQTMAEGGEVSEEAYRKLQREIVATERKLQGLEKEQKEFGSVAKQQTELTAKKYEELGRKVEGVGNKMRSAGGKLSIASAGMAAGLTTAVEGTEELRRDLSRLETNADTAGVSMDGLREQLAYAEAVTGETDSSIEALSNLLAAGIDGSNMEKVLSGLSGAAIKFSDTLKLEGLADGLQETLATGSAVGPFAEMLERSGLELEAFDKGLQAAKASGDELNYIIEIMAAAGLTDVNEEWRATNAELVASSAASSRLQTAMAELGTTLAPILTTITNAIAGVVEWFNNLSPAAQKIILVAGGIVAAVGPLLVIFGQITTGVGGIISILPALKNGITAVNTAMKANPIGIIITMIGALIAYLVHLYNSNEDFRVKVQAIFEKLKAAFNVVVEVVKIGIEKIKAFLAAVRDTVAAVVAKISAIIEAIKQRIASIVNTVSEMKTAVVNKIKDFVNIGKNIVEGIWKGIHKAKEWLIEKVREWCGSILEGIMRFFGINSPSKVMRDEVGVQLPAGMAEGIEDNAGVVTDALGTLYDDTLGAFDGYNFDIGAALNFDAPDFSGAMHDLNDAASLAVNASYQQSDELLNKIATATAQYVGQALLDGLVGVQDTILAAMPSKLELNVNGRKLAETTWTDFEAVGGLKSRLFAPSRQTIANIAASVVNTFVTA